MRILILGATGMLGHKLWQTLSPAHDVVATVRCGVEEAAAHGLFDPARLIGGVDAMRFETVERAVRETAPQVVVNAIGLIKQIDAARDPVACITLNALLPHQLATLCANLGARLIHISTDCVFSGRSGMYDESMPPDPVDLYGRSKFMGEPSGPGVLTLRTSLIGRELRGGYSLVEWFLAAQGPVRGFTQAFFSGFTTQEFSRLILRIIDQRPGLEGLLHASAGRIFQARPACAAARGLRPGDADRAGRKPAPGPLAGFRAVARPAGLHRPPPGRRWCGSWRRRRFPTRRAGTKARAATREQGATP